MPNPSKEELLRTPSGSFDTDKLSFTGPRGERARHLDRATLEERVRALPTAEKDIGVLELMVARGPNGERVLHQRARLTVAGGMPGDRWAKQEKPDDSQLAVTNASVARVIANGQPLELHGDNLYLSLDLSAENLPIGSRVEIGEEALLEVTPKAHNGCKKWAQRFGLDAMQLNLDDAWRARNLRGIYFRVVREGVVNVGERVVVKSR